MERGWLGLVRRKDRIVSGQRQASTGRFMKFWWCAGPAPSMTTSIKSSCVCSILELDLFWRICVWCYKKFDGAGKNHSYTTLHDLLPLTCLPHALFIRTSLVFSMFLNTLVDSYRGSSHLLVTLPERSSPGKPHGSHPPLLLVFTQLSTDTMRTYLAPCWKLHPLPPNHIFYLVCLASPLEFKRARYSLSPFPSLSLVPRITCDT